MSEIDIGAITLIFWSRFGAPEYNTASDKIEHLVDKALAGHIRTHRPVARGEVFTIGRAPTCTYRLGYDPETGDYCRNEVGLVQFRHFSNIHATFRLIDSTWYVYPGGEYPIDNKETEWGNPPNGLYVNGKLLPNGRDPYPLFYRTDRFSRVQLGDLGKILVMRGVFGEQSTSIPSEMWLGEGWPDMVAIGKARRRYAEAQKILHNGKAAKAQDEGVKPAAAPWWASDVMAPAWTWFTKLPVPAQLCVLTILGLLSALALWIYLHGGK